jgi:hypothetical protein
VTKQLEEELRSLSLEELKERWPSATNKVIDDFLSGTWKPRITPDSPEEPGEDDGEMYCPDCDSWYAKEYGYCPYCDGIAEYIDNDYGMSEEDNYGDESGVDYYRPDYDDVSGGEIPPIW